MSKIRSTATKVNNIYSNAKDKIFKFAGAAQYAASYVSATANPIIAGNAKSRAQILSGMSKVLGTGTRSRSKMRSADMLQHYVKDKGFGEEYTKLVRISRRASKMEGSKLEKFIKANEKHISVLKAYENRTEGVVARGRQMVKYGIGTGTGTISGRSYANALLNPRNIAIGGAAYGSVKLATFGMRHAEALRTENHGSGKLGRDSKGLLGPAGVDGFRFQTMKKRKRI